MYVALKYILFITGLGAAVVALKNKNVAAAIVSAGAFNSICAY
ncbi:MAG TPA: hypothetical protein VET23_03745 [Chitinophagaceae bacterium]|nr:hypothetical protein [Chitinophagaceae bacterium]